MDVLGDRGGRVSPQAQPWRKPIVLPVCRTCGKRKQPQGRSAPVKMAGTLCHPTECPGCREDRQAGKSWPGEEDQR